MPTANATSPPPTIRQRRAPGCKSNVGEFSDWTALVADKITITSGVKLVLNANYADSDVPVPAGVGPVGGNIALSK